MMMLMMMSLVRERAAVTERGGHCAPERAASPC